MARNASTGSTPTSKKSPPFTSGKSMSSRGPVQSTSPRASEMGVGQAKGSTKGSNADVGNCGPMGGTSCEGMTRGGVYDD